MPIVSTSSPATVSAHPATTPRRRWLAPAAAAALAVALYAQTTSFGLLSYDDAWLIADEGLLVSPTLDGLRRVWLDLTVGTRYRLGSEYLPVRDLSVMLDYAVWGRAFGGFHLTNVLLFAASCALLLLALRRWLPDAPEATWWTAVLFACHPLHVESVAWLAERKGLLCAAWVFAALWLFERFVARGGFWRGALVALAVVLAIWSKGLGIAVLGALALLLLLFPDRCRDRRRAWIGLAAVAAAAAAAFVPVWITGDRLALVVERHGGGLATTAWMMGEVHARYLGHGLLLGDLGIGYPVDAQRVDGVLAVTGVIAAAAIVFVALRAVARRERRWVGWGLAAGIWLSFLLPVSQLLFPLQNVMADRYLLLPSAGLCLAAALAIQRLPTLVTRRVVATAVALVAAALALMQTRSWADDEALYRQALRVDPRSLAAHLQLSRIARQRGQLERAAALLRRARALHPDVSAVLTHQGLLALRRGETARAIDLFRGAARDPRADQPRANLALLLKRVGRAAEGLRWAREAARIKPLRYHNQRTLGVLAITNDRREEARRALLRAHELRPGDAGTLFNLAVLAAREGDVPAARRWIRAARRAAPTDRRVIALQRRLGGEAR